MTPITFSLPAAAPSNASASRIKIDQLDPSPDGPFALLIENALTADECAQLIGYAEQRGSWERALVNVGFGEQRLMADVRNCGRIIADDAGVAAQLHARIAPFLAAAGVGAVSRTQWPGLATSRLAAGERWRMARLNERLRFLKYGPGEYFKRKWPPPPNGAR